MYVFLIAVPLFNYFDSVFYIIPTEVAYILTVQISYGLTALITAYLAIRHFVQISKRRMQRGN